MTQGIQIDLIGTDRLEKMGTAEKINVILDSVQEGNVVVLEEGLTPEEESELIEMTMAKIEPETFTGIEMESYGEKETNTGLMNRLMGSSDPTPSLTFIGPERKVKNINKQEDLLSTLVTEE